LLRLSLLSLAGRLSPSADMRGSLLLVVGLGMFFAHVWPHFRVPYDGKVEVVDGEVGGAMLAMHHQGVNWFTLTIDNTTDEPYDASAAICSFRGGIVYSPQ
jgi:hypothetical protein